MTASPILEVKGLSKSFGGVRAVDNVSFALRPGEIVGLIGPNGAGKTTLVNLLTGVFRSSAGEVFFNGEDVTRRTVDLHLKISFPFTVVVIFLLGAPLGAGTRRSGRASAFGLGVLICFVFYGSVKAGQALGWNGILAPWLGAWLAMILFGALGVWLLHRAHT